MKILITGISGFVGRHFVELLSTLNEPVEVAGIYNNHFPAFSETQYSNIHCKFYKADLLDAVKLKDILAGFSPDHILHLASASSVAYSWQFPAESIKLNTGIFLNLLEAVRSLELKSRIISVGSAEEYGNVQAKDLPLKESHCPDPVSPYGVSRIMQQKLVEIYAKNYGLDIIHTRSFNHIGPYQQDKFVLSSFARQIALQMKNGNGIELKVGNMDVIRDFTDVRDVVKAYLLLMQKGRNGQTYNISSGKGMLLKEVVSKFGNIAGREIKWISEAYNIRPFENIQLVGSYDKINKETGWQPLISIEQSLSDLLEYWQQ